MLKALSRLNPVRAVRNAQRLIDALDRVPELEARVEQCIVAYQKDARFADRLPAFQARIDAGRVQAHVRGAVAAATLERDPCPYLVITDLLPEDLYDEMLRALPPRVFFKPYPHDPTREELQVPFAFAPAYSRLVWDFYATTVVEQALVPALTEKFRPALDEFLASNWPTLGTWNESGLVLDVWNSRLLLRRPGYVIRPHRDPRWAFLTALIYLQKRGADHVYGTQLYRWRNERRASHKNPFWVNEGECELVRDVPGDRNSALIFLNSTGAHGASVPADAPPDLERYVYQAQFSPDEDMKQQLIDLLPGEDRTGWTAKGQRSY
jgi:hypothetical protein